MTALGRKATCPTHGIPDCSPLLNGCSWRPDAGREATPCSHVVATNLRCDACGEFVGVPPGEWLDDPSIGDPFDLLDDKTNEELNRTLADLSQQRRTRRSLP